MSLSKNLKTLVGQKNEVITAEVTVVDTGTAKVRRGGQTNSTKYLPVVSGLTVVVGDWVEVIMINGNINTGYLSRKIR